MNNKKILIFGGSGSIGSALAIKLKKINQSPVIISRNENDLKKFQNILIVNIEFVMF